MIENCDIALLFGLLVEADNGSGTLESLSDSEIQKVFRTIIEEYKSACMISTTAIFRLQKMDNAGWKIQDISPLKEFSTVIIGQANDLIPLLSGDQRNENNSEDR